MKWSRSYFGSWLGPQLAIAACGLLIGCAPDLDFRLDPSFDDKASEEIVQAAREWNAITNESHQITFDGNSWYIAKEKPSGEYNGLTQKSKQRIQIAPKPVGGVSHHVIAKHEFGHALGLRHTCSVAWAKGEVADDAPPCGDESLGVMDPAHATGEFTAADLAECREAGACD